MLYTISDTYALLSETAIAENSSAYYPLLSILASGHFHRPEYTDEILFKRFEDTLVQDDRILDSHAVASWKLALAARSSAPAIEAQYQFWRTNVQGLFSGGQGLTEIWKSGGGLCADPECGNVHERVLDIDTGLVDHTTRHLQFDRSYGDASHGVYTIYADLTSQDFTDTFQKWRSRHPAAAFKLRYKPRNDQASRPLVVNGYGVELALKRTDYIVIDDRESGNAKGQDDGAKTDGIESILIDEDVTDVKPLSSSELQDIGLKAASFVLESADPYDTLMTLSQDFPKHAAVLVASNYSADFAREHEANRELLLPSGFNALWINGVQIPARDVNAYTLIEILRKERRLIAKVQRLGFSAPETIRLLTHESIVGSQSADQPQRYDFRDDTEGGNVIIWLNDIEKDRRYKDYPKDVSALLQRAFPGQLLPLRKDLHNVVFPADLSNVADVTTILENLQTLVKRKVPVRFGLVPTMLSPVATEHAKILYYLHDAYGLAVVMQYLENIVTSESYHTAVSAPLLAAIEGRTLRSNRSEIEFDDLFSNENLSRRTEATLRYLSRLGADNISPPIFGNGVPITRDEEWLQTMAMQLSADLRTIQQGVFEETITQDMWLPNVFLNESSLTRNTLVIPENDKNVRLVDLERLTREHQSIFSQLQPFRSAEETKSSRQVSILVVSDLNTEKGAQLILNATEFGLMHEDVEIRFLHQCSSPSQDQTNHIKPESMAKIQGVLEKERPSFSPAHREAIGRYLTGALMSQSVTVKPEETQHNALAVEIGLASGESGVVLNGRLVGPLPQQRSFTKDDFEALLAYETQKRISPVSKALEAMELSEKMQEPIILAKLTSLVALSKVSDVPEGIYDTTPGPRTTTFEKWDSTHTCIEKGDKSSATIQLVAALDPTSGVAQRWIPIFKVLSQMDGVHLRLFLNPRQNLQELPVKRFYRYVLQHEPLFDEQGSLREPHAHFTGIPSETLLTTALDTPPSWLVAPKISPQDLDNIKLSSLTSNDEKVEAVYELEHILIEGHSRDPATGAAPRGAQLVLGTAQNPAVGGTIIMANLGYFQFKANPGVYDLALQKGATQEIFSLDSAGTQGYQPQSGDESNTVSLTSFQGSTLFPRLSRRPGKEKADVLESHTAGPDGLMAKGVKAADDLLSKIGIPDSTREKYLGKSKDIGQKILAQTQSRTFDVNASSHADINIFSVASGHLYERMLNIMMVSVMRHTQHTVKFWFIEQFLSPSFKAFLPTMAAEYKFEYEMVTFKWPHWLRAQTEKQRMIWGYKILFLDVLFPLDLDKVIFVDADQIVRTDMYDLVQHDLEGAAYGFTPMCDSRTEMEGFRFWKQGYWKNFLRGLPYHISALYVVDLKQFRAMAAGDRLRQQYQALSADPNSLSNLDQDLPNHMQMQLPIHSLPQEWLWCETWCSDESLKEARTIDLCNNPQTKEPKLDRARRQVPEWTLYDDEIGALARRGKNGSAVVEGLGQGHHEKDEETVRERPTRRMDEL
ncbi:MAG: hypothetical protein M1828_004403 [Chrysothrix sp. TS-e1954]|nr:MAG: hypothetical protein M1828_004403 [Chrysothrix sp. TS-e1954]